MTDKRITEMSAIDALADADLLEVVDDVAGTPTNKKATLTQLFSYLSGKFGSLALLANPLTTKGDIFIRNNSGIARLPVGSNGQILEAAAAEAAGLKWADKPASGKILQVQSVTWTTETNFTDSFSLNDSAPNSSQGAERFTLGITPLVSTSALLVRATVPARLRISGSTVENAAVSLQVAGGLYRDADSAAIAGDIIGFQAWRDSTNSAEFWQFGKLILEARVAANAAALTTFKVRTGRNTSGTATFTTTHNGPDTMGGLFRSRMDIWEIAA